MAGIRTKKWINIEKENTKMTGRQMRIERANRWLENLRQEFLNANDEDKAIIKRQMERLRNEIEELK